MEQKKIKDLKKGDKVCHFFLKKRCEIKTTRTNKEYLDMELGDDTGSLSAKVWENFVNLRLTDEDVKILKVAGIVEEYQNQLQIKIEQVRKTSPEDNINIEDFLPKSKRLLSEMLGELETRISKISNSHLKKLIKLILTEENFERYKKVPAGKAWHHAYIHGLLEHTLEIVRICDLMCDIHSEINRDLLICGALLHDFGKIEELTFESTFDYTDKGKLLGHIVIAALKVENIITQIDGFPCELKNQLLHLILSHQGKLEYASPVEPKTLEAIVLYHADELSAKTNAYKSAIEYEKNGDKKWTKYLPLAGTSLYIPTDEEEPKESLFD